ncbi:uncharacterized protein LOC126590358 [Malus sylvestris]|uniref:uncharacterized protein LOC126590358 n=1 Tax=Malus sylvestris TaxID=3752 RepID=UPI0021ABAC2E|nr:uncharacterized protein LOC126590358 [Malus sylvestris]
MLLIECKVDDWVFLKLSPWKGVVRFGKKGKLSPRYIGPYQIIERVSEVAYRLELPPKLSKVHDVFHVSMVCHYVSDLSHVIPFQPLEINPNLTYDEEPVTILNSKDKVLRNKTVRLVKVWWGNHSVEEATSETEDSMKEISFSRNRQLQRLLALDSGKLRLKEGNISSKLTEYANGAR